MALELGDSTFRPLLRDDIISAWEVEQIHYDPPAVPGTASVLPRAFLQLGNIDAGEKRGLTRTVLFHTYTIAGQFPFPEEGTLEEAKVARVNELLAVLTAGGTIYESVWRYRFDGVDFETSRTTDDEAEDYYTVMITFSLEWVTGV